MKIVAAVLLQVADAAEKLSLEGAQTVGEAPLDRYLDVADVFVMLEDGRLRELGTVSAVPQADAEPGDVRTMEADP